MSYVTTVQ